MGDVRQIAVAGVKVGLAGLDRAFETACAETYDSDGDLSDRLLELVGTSNYIPQGKRDDYGVALLREFKRYMGEEVLDERTSLEIRVFGIGCPRCERLMQEVLTALAELGLNADIEHVKDMNKIAELGPVGMPVLMINDKIVSSGRDLTRKEIKQLLEETT
jgi:small redox-active disulfide protein 2